MPTMYKKLLILSLILSDVHGFGTFIGNTKTKPSSSVTEPATIEGFPDVYTEARQMIDISTLMYALPEVRDLARENEFENSEAFLQEPIAVRDFVGLMKENIDVIRGISKFNPDEDPFQKLVVDSFKDIVERNAENEAATIVEINDEEKDKELVYAVVVDPSMERITVAFRGTNTIKDGLVDASAWLKRAKNPMRRLDENQPRNLEYHAGFYRYLFDPNELTEAELSSFEATDNMSLDYKEGDEISKFDEILNFHLLPTLKKYPGYKVYISGHSLGAALATEFAFQVAAIDCPEIPKPVTCVSVASPYVGDRDFRKAFKLAERKNLIRHLRVGNHRDIVTLSFFISIRFNPFDDDKKLKLGKLYKHVGVNLKLFEDGMHEFNYPIDDIFTELKHAWGNCFFSNLIANISDHGTQVYSERLEKNKAQLEGLQLDDLYDAYFKEDI